MKQSLLSVASNILVSRRDVCTKFFKDILRLVFIFLLTVLSFGEGRTHAITATTKQRYDTAPNMLQYLLQANDAFVGTLCDVDPCLCTIWEKIFGIVIPGVHKFCTECVHLVLKMAGEHRNF